MLIGGGRGENGVVLEVPQPMMNAHRMHED